MQDYKRTLENFKKQLLEEVKANIGKPTTNKAVALLGGGNLKFLDFNLSRITLAIEFKAENFKGAVNPYIVDSYEYYCEVVYKLALETSDLVSTRLHVRVQLDYVDNDLGFKVIEFGKANELIKDVLVSVLEKEPSEEDIKNTHRILSGKLKYVSSEDDDYVNKLCTACLVYEKLLEERKQADMRVINRDFIKIFKSNKDLIVKYYRLLLLSSVNLIGSRSEEFRELEEILTLDEQAKLDRDFREHLESLEDMKGLEGNINKERILVVHSCANGLHKIDGKEFLFIEYFTFQRLLQNDFIEFNKFYRIVDGRGLDEIRKRLKINGIN